MGAFADYVKDQLSKGLVELEAVKASPDFSVEVLTATASSIPSAQLHTRGDLTKVKYIGYNVKETGGYMQNGINGIQLITEFMTDALVFEFKTYQNGGMYTIEVDGKIINPDGIILPNTTSSAVVQFVKLTAKDGVTKKFRHFKIYSLNTAYAGFYTEAKDTMTSDIVKEGRKFIYQLGDSYTFGTGGGFPGKTYGSSPAINDFYHFRRSLNLDGIAEGIGGSAWTSSEAPRLPVTRVQTRLAQLSGAKPDFVSLAMGLNDATSIITTPSNQALLKQRMSDCIKEVRKTLPGVPIVAISCATPVGPVAGTTKVFELVQEVCAEYDVEYINVSNVITTLNGWDLYTSNNAAGLDQNHPTPLGHRIRGEQMVKSILSAIDSSTSLIPKKTQKSFVVTYIKRSGFSVEVLKDSVSASSSNEAYWKVKSAEYSNPELRIEIISVV